jgi:hypothetical protein
MRHVLTVFTLIHGIGHLPGFAVSWRLLTTAELPYRTSILGGRLDLGDAGIRAWGLVWLALSIAFGVIAVGIWSRSSWWLGALTAVVGISSLFCLFALPETRLGLAANAIVFVLACAAVRYPAGAPAVGYSRLEELWRSAPAGSSAAFDLGTVPDAGKPYLSQVIAPGTFLAASVRVRMQGQIKLGTSWHPFQAEQVIVPGRGMIWAGTVSMFGLPVVGADQILDGSGLLLWKLLDIVPVAQAEGPDTSRSGIGRLMGEMAVWLPSVLCAAPASGYGIEWTAVDQRHIRLRLNAFGENVELTIERDDGGHIRAFSFARWGNPDGGPHRYVDFGVTVEEKRTIRGYTVPTRIRAGWYYGTDRFATDGEFFRATIDELEFK